MLLYSHSSQNQAEMGKRVGNFFRESGGREKKRALYPGNRSAFLGSGWKEIPDQSTSVNKLYFFIIIPLDKLNVYDIIM